MQALMISPIGEMARRMAAGAWGILAVAGLCLWGAGEATADFAQMILFLTGAVCLTSALILIFVRLGQVLRRQFIMNVGRRLCQFDPSPSLLVTEDGAIVYKNAQARQTFGDSASQDLGALLGQSCADPAAVMSGLHQQAQGQNVVEEVIWQGRKRSNFVVSDIGSGLYFWRFEGALAKAGQNDDCIPVPVLTIDAEGQIHGANACADTILAEDVTHLGQVCETLPLKPGQVQDIQVFGRSVPVVVGLEPDRQRRAFRKLVLSPLPRTPTALQPAGTLIDDLPVPLLKLDATGKIVLSNQSARRLLRNALNAGQRLEDLVEGLGRSMIDWLGDAIAGRGDKHAEFLKLKNQERDVFVQIVLNRIKEHDETLLIAVLSDATEFKSLEAQFVQSQKMEAIGQLAGGIAHDFNNLLTAISGHCDLLLLRHGSEESEYADLMQISQNANRAAALVSQLLAYSRKQTLKPTVIDLRETLSDVSHLLNRLVGEKVSMSVFHGPELWAIRADQRQFEQVLVNLVVNARDAMPEGGEIRIETSNCLLEAPLHRDRATVAPGRYVKVEIRDEGCGISPEKIQKVFEPFFTTKRAGEGTGLGLSTAYGIIKQTGGFIFVDSVVNQGAIFTLMLPSYDGETPQITPRSSEPETHATGGVVLLVEDEAPVRAFACRALQMRGFTVIEADSGEQALRLLQDRSLHVDVFVTDVIMPGLDGPGWVRDALRARPGTATVFMSGYAEESFSDKQARIENSVYLQKPFSLPELTQTVARQISEHRLN